jgi:hypothetical protein
MDHFLNQPEYKNILEQQNEINFMSTKVPESNLKVAFSMPNETQPEFRGPLTEKR